MRRVNEPEQRAAAELRVLGVDLGMRGSTTGSAVLGFQPRGSWVSARTGVVSWPDQGELAAGAVAATIDAYARENGIAAVSIDGPQGWRAPDAGNRPGVGRRCDYECRTPGKVGVHGISYPRTWIRWIRFSIDVFAILLERSGVRLVNEVSLAPGTSPHASLPSGSGYLLLECFPTSIWRTAGLTPLPGHAKVDADGIRRHAGLLCDRFGLPLSGLTTNHDDLQALVAALPAAAVVRGPCAAVPRGEPSRLVQAPVPHRVEGIIWDAR